MGTVLFLFGYTEPPPDCRSARRDTTDTHPPVKSSSWLSVVVDTFMNFLGESHGSGSRKRTLEAPDEEGTAAGSPPSNFPRFALPAPAPAPTTEAEGSDSGDRDPYGEDSDIFDESHLPNDTMATVLALQKEFYGDGKNSAPGARATSGERTGVVLQHQIYTVLENRTAADLELTAMRKDNVLRTFRLGTGREDWGVMSTEHYLRVISNMLGETSSQPQGGASSRPGASAASLGGRTSLRATSSTPPGPRTKSAPEHRTSFAGDVLERLVLSNTKAYASRKQVANAMREVEQTREGVAGATQGKSREGSGRDAGGGAAGGGIAGDESSRPGSLGKRKGQQCNSKAKGGGDDPDLRSLKRSEEEMLSVTSKLIRAGFLLPRRDVGREEAYWFSMPQLGKVVTAITRGRKDIVAALKRTRYKEMRRAAMEKKNPAKSTGLPLSFHVRDLLGLGMIQELDTPSGTFLRLPSDAS
eukprot:g15361.t1